MEIINETVDGILRDLKEFLRYLASAWGILSVFTPLFPLIGQFRSLLPLPSPYPDMFALLATLAGIFAIFDKFTCRHSRHSDFKVSPKLLFLCAISVTVFYLVVLPNLPITPIEQQLGIRRMPVLAAMLLNLVKAVAKAFPPALYISIFYLFTDSFAILAVKEYQNRNGSR